METMKFTVLVESDRWEIQTETGEITSEGHTDADVPPDTPDRSSDRLLATLEVLVVYGDILSPEIPELLHDRAFGS